MRVYKYPILLTETQTIMVPGYRRLLSVQLQDDRICLWYEINEDHENDTEIVLHIVPTGGDRDIEDDWHHLETIQMGSLVWHVYQEGYDDWNA